MINALLFYASALAIDSDSIAIKLGLNKRNKNQLPRTAPSLKISASKNLSEVSSAQPLETEFEQDLDTDTYIDDYPIPPEYIDAVLLLVEQKVLPEWILRYDPMDLIASGLLPPTDEILKVDQMAALVFPEMDNKSNMVTNDSPPRSLDLSGGMYADMVDRNDPRFADKPELSFQDLPVEMQMMFQKEMDRDKRTRAENSDSATVDGVPFDLGFDIDILQNAARRDSEDVQHEAQSLSGPTVLLSAYPEIGVDLKHAYKKDNNLPLDELKFDEPLGETKVLVSLHATTTPSSGTTEVGVVTTTPSSSGDISLTTVEQLELELKHPLARRLKDIVFEAAPKKIDQMVLLKAVEAKLSNRRTMELDDDVVQNEDIASTELPHDPQAYGNHTIMYGTRWDEEYETLYTYPYYEVVKNTDVTLTGHGWNQYSTFFSTWNDNYYNTHWAYQAMTNPLNLAPPSPFSVVQRKWNPAERISKFTQLQGVLKPWSDMYPAASAFDNKPVPLFSQTTDEPYTGDILFSTKEWVGINPQAFDPDASEIPQATVTKQLSSREDESKIKAMLLHGAAQQNESKVQDIDKNQQEAMQFHVIHDAVELLSGEVEDWKSRSNSGPTTTEAPGLYTATTNSTRGPRDYNGMPDWVTAADHQFMFNDMVFDDSIIAEADPEAWAGGQSRGKFYYNNVAAAGTTAGSMQDIPWTPNIEGVHTTPSWSWNEFVSEELPADLVWEHHRWGGWKYYDSTPYPVQTQQLGFNKHNPQDSDATDDGGSILHLLDLLDERLEESVTTPDSPTVCPFELANKETDECEEECKKHEAQGGKESVTSACPCKKGSGVATTSSVSTNDSHEAQGIASIFSGSTVEPVVMAIAGPEGAPVAKSFGQVFLRQAALQKMNEMDEDRVNAADAPLDHWGHGKWLMYDSPANIEQSMRKYARIRINEEINAIVPGAKYEDDNKPRIIDTPWDGETPPRDFWTLPQFNASFVGADCGFGGDCGTSNVKSIDKIEPQSVAFAEDDVPGSYPEYVTMMTEQLAAVAALPKSLSEHEAQWMDPSLYQNNKDMRKYFRPPKQFLNWKGRSGEEEKQNPQDEQLMTSTSPSPYTPLSLVKVKQQLQQELDSKGLALPDNLIDEIVRSPEKILMALELLQPGAAVQ